MHNAGFQALKLPFSYVAFDTGRTEFALRTMRELGFRGLSLTIPHKVDAINFVDELSADASEIRAVNTVINDGQKLWGFNTDWQGIVDAVNETKLNFKGREVLVLGAGGAARAAIYAMRSLGVGSISLTNRSVERARELAEQFQAKVVSPDELAVTDLSKFALLINSTPLGGVGLPDISEHDYPIPLANIPSSVAVFDMVTNDTPLVQAAKRVGARLIPGLRMLLFQAMGQFKLFTDEEPPRAVMERALEEASQLTKKG